MNYFFTFLIFFFGKKKLTCPKSAFSWVLTRSACPGVKYSTSKKSPYEEAGEAGGQMGRRRGVFGAISLKMKGGGGAHHIFVYGFEGIEGAKEAQMMSHPPPLASLIYRIGEPEPQTPNPKLESRLSNSWP